MSKTENQFIKNLNDFTNYSKTENGALTHTTTTSALYDLFAFGAAYRTRNDEDCILLFKNAYEEDPLYALKCLFYIRNCRGGQGERRFFRVCYAWLAKYDPETASSNLNEIVKFGRWDDIIDICLNWSVDLVFKTKALEFIKAQFVKDIQSETPSLLAKWLPSENASSQTTKFNANTIRKYLNMTHKEYRKTLSILRKRINVLERLMSSNDWKSIEFDKIPSKAGFNYRHAFLNHPEIAEQYATFIRNKNTKVNVKTLYPYEIVKQAIYNWNKSLDDPDRQMIEKYWKNLPDYLEGKDCKILCVIDTSASMYGQPINVAISLGMYCAERITGPFANQYISFSRQPKFIKIEGVDFVDKVHRIYKTNLCQNTNLIATFELLREAAVHCINKNDIPDNIIVISDMEIDVGCEINNLNTRSHRTELTSILTEMEQEREKWRAEGLKMPHLTYWNVNARHENILDLGSDVSYVSGMSPILFKQILTCKTGYDLMIETLKDPIYDSIVVKFHCYNDC